MPTSFSKGPPLRFHLNLPTDDDDDDLRDRVVAVRLRQGLPAHSAKMASVIERMRSLTEEMARL